ncbi:MAG: HisA/HisF-related TIM barrel protein [Actinomycetota bacterium]
MSFTLYPAVDLKGGKAVRLVKGAEGTETDYGRPLEAAVAWASQGASWLHVVDLDAAFGRGPVNRSIIGEIVAAVAPVKVEASGGVRDEEALEALLGLGAARVVLGTAALEERGFVGRALAAHAGRLAIGLDARGTTLQARGWTRPGGDLWETLASLEDEGAGCFIYTDVERDGMLVGPNLEMLGELARRSRGEVIASGGVGSLEDLKKLAKLEGARLGGAIVGKALYAGRFDVRQALGCLEALSPKGSEEA